MSHRAGRGGPGREPAAATEPQVTLGMPDSGRRENEAAATRKRRAPECRVPAASGAAEDQAEASAVSSVKLRVLLGSTGMPGPIVVVKVTFFRYRPLAAAGLSLITSSRAAA